MNVEVFQGRVKFRLNRAVYCIIYIQQPTVGTELIAVTSTMTYRGESENNYDNNYTIKYLQPVTGEILILNTGYRCIFYNILQQTVLKSTRSW